MLTVSNEYGIYLYSDKVDMRKGIDGLCEIVRSQMGLSPFKSKSIFVFGGKNPRSKKVLIREYNRFELVSIRLAHPERLLRGSRLIQSQAHPGEHRGLRL